MIFRESHFDAPSVSLRADQMVCTRDVGVVCRVLHDFERALNGESVESFAILGSRPIQLSEEDRNDFVLLLDTIDMLARIIDPEVYDVLQQEPFREFFWKFLLTLSPSDVPEQMVDQLWQFIDALRPVTDPWVIDDILNHITRLRRQFTLLLKLHMTTRHATDFVTNQLGFESQIAAFITEGAGYEIVSGDRCFQVILDAEKLVTPNAK